MALIKRNLGDELAKQGQSQEDDPGLAREASAFYLKLSESLLADTPDNLKLAEAVAAPGKAWVFAHWRDEFVLTCPADRVADSPLTITVYAQIGTPVYNMYYSVILSVSVPLSLIFVCLCGWLNRR